VIGTRRAYDAPARWNEFRQRYERGLEANIDVWTPILEASKKGVVTLLYGPLTDPCITADRRPA